MGDTIEIHGRCEPRFAAVRDAFGANFREDAEVGASFAAFVDGECVVDLWAGTADAAGTRPWEQDTIVNVFSTTKPMAALATLMLVDRGLLDLDQAVAEVWPEFAQAGKEHVRIRHLLSHSSGLSGWAEPITVETLYDWDRAVGLLATQEPWWEPGTKSGYHAITHGHLLGEVVRRVSGRTLGRFFRDEVATPLGADFHIGLDETHEPRVGEIIPPDAPGLGAGSPTKRASVAARTFRNPPMSAAVANTRPWRAAELPAINGQSNARAVARIAGTLACGGTLDGVSLLGPDTLARAIEEQTYDKDLVLGVPIRYGLGVGLTSKEAPIGPNPRTFFWGGWGGSLMVVDLDARIGFSYVMNKMAQTTLGDRRAFGPAAALFTAA